MAAEPTLPVWIRYLLETWSQDLVLDVAELEVPTLLLKPGFDADYAPPDGADFMTFATDRSWDGVEAASEFVTVRVVEDARLFIMDDQPALLDRTVADFLGSSSRQSR